MPIFPPTPVPTIDIAAIWTYGTRALTDKAGFTISGTKTTLDDLVDLAAADVWAAGSRALSTPADYMADISSLPILTEIEASDVIATQAKQGTIEGKVDTIDGVVDKIPGYEAPVEASVEMIIDTEVNLVEKTDNKIGILDGLIDLSTMEAGDTITIRQAMQIKTAGDYVTYAEETYSGVQTVPLLAVITRTAKDKVKITAEQTAGTVRTLDVQFYRRLQA